MVISAEQGARLTLQILLRIFKADTLLNKGLLHRSAYIKNSCDLHLLAAANRSIQIIPLLAVLKVSGSHYIKSKIKFLEWSPHGFAGHTVLMATQY